MHQPKPVLVFSINCPTNEEKKVELATRNWWEERDGINHIIRLRESCPCCGTAFDGFSQVPSK